MEEQTLRTSLENLDLSLGSIFSSVRTSNSLTVTVAKRLIEHTTILNQYILENQQRINTLEEKVKALEEKLKEQYAPAKSIE